MEQKTSNRGGFRPGAGRKRRSDEQKLIDELDRIIDPEQALFLLVERMQRGDTKAITLYMNYRYGKPVQTIDQTTNLSINEVDISKMIQFEEPKKLNDSTTPEV